MILILTFRPLKSTDYNYPVVFSDDNSNFHGVSRFCNLLYKFPPQKVKKCIIYYIIYHSCKIIYIYDKEYAIKWKYIIFLLVIYYISLAGNLFLHLKKGVSFLRMLCNKMIRSYKMSTILNEIYIETHRRVPDKEGIKTISALIILQNVKLLKHWFISTPFFFYGSLEHHFWNVIPLFGVAFYLKTTAKHYMCTWRET